MSNYLFAMGKEDLIFRIRDFFIEEAPDNSNEISVSHQFDEYWALVIDNKAPQVKSSISDINDNKKGHFFKGWFQDHNSKSIVIGPEGYHDWQDSQNTTAHDLEGAYICAHWTHNSLVIENDLFSYFPVMFFSTNELVVASDSMYILSRIRRALNLPCKLNRDVIHSRSWTHGLACAMMSNETQIEDIKLLSPGKIIDVKMGNKLSTKIIHKPIKELFPEVTVNYEKALIEATKNLYSSTISFLDVKDIHIQFGLSGGLDSRLILAILLKNPKATNKVSITTNTHISKKGDFNIVAKLAKKYDFDFNNKEAEIIEHKKNPSVEPTSTGNKFGFWALSNMGLFDMMYLRTSHWKHPNIIELGGHGAETVKGTFSTHSVSKLFPIMRNSFRYFYKAHHRWRKRKKIRKEMAKGLESSGIDINGKDAIQWHHFCYKSPIQNGRYLDRSIIALRPFIQKSLFVLSRSNSNPFLNAKKGEPTLLHDMLILLDQNLAAEPFENSKNNIDESYIAKRLEKINTEISFEDIKPYNIHGEVTDVLNGPPKAFMQLVEHLDIGKKSLKEGVLEMLEEQWNEVKNTELGPIYQSAYDTAKERLEDPDYYPPSAGTPAAKILSLMMCDY